MSKLDIQQKTFTTDSGHIVKLKSIPYMQFARMQTDRRGAPTPPVVQVTIGGMNRAVENYDDPRHVERLAEWEADRQLRIMNFTLAKGASIDVPPSFIDENASFYPNASPLEMMVFYLYEIMTQDEIQELFQAIISQTTATMQGVADAANRFPANDQPNVSG